jgi:hypothetical protein
VDTTHNNYKNEGNNLAAKGFIEYSGCVVHIFKHSELLAMLYSESSKTLPG